MLDTARQIVRFFRREFRMEHPRTVPLLNCVKPEAARTLGWEVMAILGDIYMDQSDFQLAEQEIMAVAEIKKSRNSIDLNDDYWKSFAHLINRHRVQNGHPAETILQRLVPQVNEHFGPEHPNTISMKAALGRAYREVDKLVEAERI